MHFPTGMCAGKKCSLCPFFQGKLFLDLVGKTLEFVLFVCAKIASASLQIAL